MRYLALGDSISADDYTGVQGGGAASRVVAHFKPKQSRIIARDGISTEIAFDLLNQIDFIPTLVTLTVGGNDVMNMGFALKQDLHASLDLTPSLRMIEAILAKLDLWGAKAILSTCFDPSDGNDLLLEKAGFPPEAREILLFRLNDGIRQMASENVAICDIYALFQGHGMGSPEPYVTLQVEPNLAGATAIGNDWIRIITDRGWA